MALNRIGVALKNSFNKITNSLLVDKKLIDEVVKDIQRALLQGDVNVNMVLEFSQRIRKRAIDEKPPASMTQKEHTIKIIYDEITKILGEKELELKILKKKPFKIMMVGLYGSGKTTSIGKLARYYSTRGYKVGILGLDIQRPAAMEQIKQVGEKINIPVYVDKGHTNKKEKNPIKVYKEFEKDYAKYDILIIDTAGRDALSKELINELSILNNKIKPDERILVISADIGQAAYEQAKAFHDSVGVSGIFVTKLDGTAKGGGALVGCAATGAKIYFIGVGEKVGDIEKFNPEGFVSRLLGMGDLKALLEKSREAISEEEAKDLGKKMIGGEFNLIDLYEQMKAMSKMGPLSKVLEMIPGMSQLKGKLPKEMLSAQEGKLKTWKYIMDSMTKDELVEPDEVLNTERIERIAKGAGVTTKEVRELVKQYKQSNELMTMMKGKDPQKLMRKLRGKMSF